MVNLFESLPDEHRVKLVAAFKSEAGESLEDVLRIYSEAFARERYRFEKCELPWDTRPTTELVELASYFSDYVGEILKCHRAALRKAIDEAR